MVGRGVVKHREVDPGDILKILYGFIAPWLGGYATTLLFGFDPASAVFVGTALAPEIMIFLTVLTVVAIITKVVECGLPARAMGMCREDSLIVGFGMAPQGEVAMFVALIGLEQGLIGQGIFVAIVLMSLLTTIITPIVYRNWFFRGAYCTWE